MSDPRTIITILIGAYIIYHYLGIWAVFWCAVFGILVAFLSLVYIVINGEAKTIILKEALKKLWKKYLKVEAKFFRWIDSL